MRSLLRQSFLLLFIFLSVSVSAQTTDEIESLGLPGDNLNLYAVLKIFQESATLEEFEKKLNDPENKINNLDLNGDNEVDYIQVSDQVEKNVHSITLQVATDKNEMQNVAVFVVDNSDGKTEIQVVGDEDLYGKDYIIEPNYDNQTDQPGSTPNPGYNGNTVVANAQAQPQTVIVERQIISPVQVAAWPIVQFIYAPSYVVWRSPWRWGYYPNYWRPWHPYFFHYYYGYHYHWNYYYQGYYRRWYHYRQPWWPNYYYQSNWRYRSNVYYNRYRRGDFRTTYSRPDMIRDGSSYYRRRYPNTPGYTARVPPVRVPDRRPPITRPGTRPTPRPVAPGGGTVGIRPGNRLPPATVNPGTRPGTGNRLPSTNPATRPGNRLPPPTTRPVTPPGNRLPSTRPATRPVDPTPAVRPAPRPASPSPSVRPAPRPANPSPSVRPASRPANPSPSVRQTPRPSNPSPFARPAPQQNRPSPSVRPAPRPAPRQAPSRPAPRPAPKRD